MSATRHVEGNLDRLRLAKEPRAGDFGGQLQTQGTENGTPCAEPTTWTTLLADRNRRLEIVLPNALHRQLRTESAAESPGDQSAPNKQSGVTSSRKLTPTVVAPRGEDVCALHSTRRQQKAQSPQASTHTQSRLSNLLRILCDTLARRL